MAMTYLVNPQAIEDEISLRMKNPPSEGSPEKPATEAQPQPQAQQGLPQ